MNYLLFFSNFMIPFVIFSIILSGIIKKLPVFDLFTAGTERGFETVLKMAPVLIGLLSAVSALRASGLLTFMETLFLPVEKLFSFPARLIPLIFVRLFSTSAATGFLLDIFKEAGPDSFTGFSASVIMSCTEAAFYTMSIYFSSVHIKKTRWTLPGALFSSFAGIGISIVLSALFLC
ncbi:MAG: spore maturation protein [Lachnospiraceae bacterium]|nr:spore maturation protein [Lachnospiraceae bacterium]